MIWELFFIKYLLLYNRRAGFVIRKIYNIKAMQIQKIFTKEMYLD